MIIQAKLANQLAKEFDWRKFTLDNVMTTILNSAKSGYFTTSLYQQKDLSKEDFESIIETLEKNGFTIVRAADYNNYCTIHWN